MAVFLFFICFGEIFKKIIVNSRKHHKIDNLILLDSTWVYIHSNHIIWYALV